jgi:O-6-methylguanine DNA methyltransferase
MQSTIYYTQVNSPWGSLFLAGTEASICSCEFMLGKDVSSLCTRLKQQYGEVPLQEDGLPLASAVDHLKQYATGEPGHLNHPLNLRGTAFQLQVWSALQQIPLGRVATYGEIAARIGSPGGARAVGQACGRNPVVLFVPCHRVVATQGRLGGFGSGLELKRALLLHEGVNWA